MNIEQIKTDMTNGVMVSRVTVAKLVEAALMMENVLKVVEEAELPIEAIKLAARGSRKAVEAL